MMEQFIKKSLPYHLQIYEILKDEIINGDFESGERIYESKIAQKFKISRSPIREALRILEQDELVVLSSNGLIVNPMEFKDIEEVYECRMAVEPFAARLTAQNINEETILKLEELIETAKNHHKNKLFSEIVEANTEFHDIIIKTCGNNRLIAISDKLRSLSLLSRRTEFETFQRDDNYLTEHMDILNALRKRDGEAAERALRDHISNDVGFYRNNYDKIQCYRTEKGTKNNF